MFHAINEFLSRITHFIGFGLMLYGFVLIIQGIRRRDYIGGAGKGILFLIAAELVTKL